MKSCIIYALIDPTTNTPFYIGATSSSPEIRLSQHIGGQKTSKCIDSVVNRRVDFIQRLIKSGNDPILKVLETVPAKDVDDREQYYYDCYMSRGIDLIQSGCYFIYSRQKPKASKKIIKIIY